MNKFFRYTSFVLSVFSLATFDALAAELLGWTQNPGEQSIPFNQTKTDSGVDLNFTNSDGQPRMFLFEADDKFNDVISISGAVYMPKEGQRIRITLSTTSKPIIIVDLRAKNEWQTFNAKIPVGSGTAITGLKLQVVGAGFTQIKDFRALIDPNIASNAAAIGRSGWFSRHFKGDSAEAAGWSNWTETGTAIQLFDDSIRKEGSRSIMIKSVGGYTYASTAANWENPAQRFRIKSFARANGILDEALVCIKFMDKNWKELEWLTLAQIPDTGEWIPFDVVAKAPQGTTCASMLIIFKGEGAVWLDEPLVTVE
jgi:hypothetical protein